MPATRPADVRFWEKVDKDGPIPECDPTLGPCWIWTAATDRDGYGVFSVVRGLLRKAHIWAWEQINGPTPDGLELDHLCRVKGCVRPSHLEAVTHGENISRARKARTHCRRGHDFSTARIRKRDGARICRECAREDRLAYEQRKAAKNA